MSGTFQHHSIVLPDGSDTLPGGKRIADSPTCRFACQIFQAFGCQSIVDLGCLEGGFAVEFSKQFASVLGVEVREDSFQCCQSLIPHFNVQFINADVTTIDTQVAYDGVYCGGLLYHIENPLAFLTRLRQLTRKVCIVDTHFSSEMPHYKFKQSALCLHEDLLGRWYQEFSETTHQMRDEYRLSSWGNTRSFWIHRAEISPAFRRAGFSRVLELMGPEQINQRGLFVALP